MFWDHLHRGEQNNKEGIYKMQPRKKITLKSESADVTDPDWTRLYCPDQSQGYVSLTSKQVIQ